MSQQKTQISNTTLLWICYGLYGAALICGGITSLIAVIIAHIKRKDTQDPFTLNHLNWQIATFWQSLIGLIVLAVITFVLTITVILSFLAYPLWLLFVIWYIYRVTKGALALNSGRMV